MELQEVYDDESASWKENKEWNEESQRRLPAESDPEAVSAPPQTKELAAVEKPKDSDENPISERRPISGSS